MIFVEGKTTKPLIKHDHGFLDDGKGNIDKSKMREPTPQDYWAYAKWTTKASAAEYAFWLTDAVKAYEHFLWGMGTEREVDYEGFVEDDTSGQTMLKMIIKFTTNDAITIFSNKFPIKSLTNDFETTFQMYTPKALSVGGSSIFPYPKTENWQKAIGAHFIWCEAIVNLKRALTTKITNFDIKLTLNAEDMYNFNPGNKDIKTKIPDEENGRFELCGLAHEYINKGSISRSITFTISDYEIDRFMPDIQNMVVKKVNR
jgi:hypothetical protein